MNTTSKNIPQEIEFHFQGMRLEWAQAIAGWHYEGMYAFYDMSEDPDDLAELLDPSSWENRYFAVTRGGEELAGFFCFELEGQRLSIGLGLRPDLTGKGIGLAFLEAGLTFARERFHPCEFAVDVALFNQRAIRVYKKVGFKDGEVYLRETNGGQFEFTRLTRPANPNPSDQPPGNGMETTRNPFPGS